MNKFGKKATLFFISVLAWLVVLTSCNENPIESPLDTAGKLIFPSTETETASAETETNRVENTTAAESVESETTATEPDVEETTVGEIPANDDAESLKYKLGKYFDCFEVGNTDITKSQIEYLSAHSEWYFGKTFTVFGIYEKRVEPDGSHHFVIVNSGDYSRAFAVTLPSGKTFKNGESVVMKGCLIPHTGEEKSSLCYALETQSCWREPEYTVQSEEFSHAEAQNLIVKTQKAYVCSAPDTSKIIAEISKGTHVEVIEFSECWWKAIYDSKECYIPRSSLGIEQLEEETTEESDDLRINKNRTFNPPREMEITASSLKIRSTPDFDTEGNVIDYFYEGDRVSVTAELEGGFYVFVYNGKKAEYVGKNCYIGRAYTKDIE